MALNIGPGILDGLKDLDESSDFQIKDIDINKIIPNPKNFYRVNNTDVESLANDIKENNLYHNLLVRKIQNKEGEEVYELISGERRLTALKLLNYEKAPCRIIESNDVDAEIKLIQANARTRDRTDQEKAKEIERLTELFRMKQIQGEKVPGNTRDNIGNYLGMSGANVTKYQNINKSLIPELKELFDTEKLSFSNAYEFSKLDIAIQKELYINFKDKLNMSRKEALKLKKQLLEKEEEIKLEKLNNENIQGQVTKLESLLAEKQNQINYIQSSINKIRDEEKISELQEKLLEAELEIKKINEEKTKIIDKKPKFNLPDIETITIKVELDNIISNLNNNLSKVSDILSSKKNNADIIDSKIQEDINLALNTIKKIHDIIK